MTPKSAYQRRRNRLSWFGLLAGALGLMILLAACGGGAGASASSAGSPAITPTPVATTSVVTNTPTVLAPTPLPGLTQGVLFVDNDGSGCCFCPAPPSSPTLTTLPSPKH